MLNSADTQNERQRALRTHYIEPFHCNFHKTFKSTVRNRLTQKILRYAPHNTESPWQLSSTFIEYINIKAIKTRSSKIKHQLDLISIW